MLWQRASVKGEYIAVAYEPRREAVPTRKNNLIKRTLRLCAMWSVTDAAKVSPPAGKHDAAAIKEIIHVQRNPAALRRAERFPSLPETSWTQCPPRETNNDAITFWKYGAFIYWSP